MNPGNPYQPQQPPQHSGPQPMPQQGQYANGQPLYGAQGPVQQQAVQGYSGAPQQVTQPSQGQPLPGIPTGVPSPQQLPSGPRPRRKGFNVPVLLAVLFLISTLGFGGAFAWAYINYTDQKDNVDSKITVAKAETKKEVEEKADVVYAEKEKQPNRQFVGPEDYGRVSFDYPKTWSVYVPRDASTSGGSFEAYFNPVVVPAISTTQQYALRLTIENRDYDKVIDTYKSAVTRGDLKLTPVKTDDQNGSRLDGAFTKDVHGSAVIFKIRDKTVTFRTDAQTFTADFDALIKTITFNK